MKLSVSENPYSRKINILNGMRDGIPICLGYIAVSFTFGIMARNTGLSVFQAVLISATNLTSAGQFAALGIIGASSSYVEMAFTQLIINLRYCLMSCALSQKFDERTKFYHRFFVAYGVTDEIFAVTVGRPGKLRPAYSYGMIFISAFGWTLGTFLGIVSGSILPERIISALSVALYGMFIAIIIPPAKKDKVIRGIVIISMLLSLAFGYIPVIKEISSGFKIIILTVLIAGVAAALFPVKDDVSEEQEEGGVL